LRLMLRLHLGIAVRFLKAWFLEEAISKISVLSYVSSLPILLARLAWILADNVDCFVRLDIKVLEGLAEVNEFRAVDCLRLIVGTTHFEVELLLPHIDLVFSKPFWLRLAHHAIFIFLLVVVVFIFIFVCVLDVGGVIVIVKGHAFIGMNDPTMWLPEPFGFFILIVFILSCLPVLFLARQVFF
jgi:hypothetical protein